MRTKTVTAAILFTAFASIGGLAVTGCKAAPAADTSGASAQLSGGLTASASNSANTTGTAPANTFSGTVAETMTSGNYTYLRLTNGQDELWAAAPQFDAKTGETISIALDMPVREFQSRTLNRTFPLIYFVSEVGTNGQPPIAQAAAAPPLMNSHTNAPATPTTSPEKIEPPTGGLPIADVFAKRAALSGKQVTVRGAVVKVNAGILDRNFVHLQDGSGTAGARDNDLTVTTTADVKIGDVVTASGVLGTNKDLGAGFAYDAILEQATISPR